jgi:catechol 1,2-dioxygenase
MSLRKKDRIDRREFISKTGMIAVAISVPGFVSCADDRPDNVLKKDCNTTADILGPFYKPDAPFREDIVPSGTAEAPLMIQGKVFGDCDTELKGAVVEIWNADAEGKYDDSNAFRFRGRHKTDEDGIYRFRTIIPGRYLNGGTYRPSHFHFRITAPGYGELVSQIYFKDDPFIAKDPWAGDPAAAERILALGKDENDTDTITFDVYIKRLV